MKKLLVPLIIAGLSLASLASAAAYDYHVNWQDGTNNPATIDAAPSAYVTSFLGNDITNNVPAFYHVDGTQLVFDDTSHTLSVGLIQPSQVDTLSATLADHGSRISTLESSETSQNSSISANTSSISSQSSAISLINSKLSGLTATSTWVNNVATSTKLLMFNGTTASGAITFNLTADGTTNGVSLCPNGVAQVNVVANDPNNTFGLGWTVTNSNKQLNITANVRSFTSTTVLGITVLGSTALAAAPNGTPLYAFVNCN